MRKVVFLNIIVLFSLVLASCGAPATTPAPTSAPTTAPEPTTVPPTEPPASKFQESPMLADKVTAGDLPAVDERLPENPRVIKALTGEQGVYGGEMRVGFTGTAPEWGAFLWVAAWDHLVSWAPDFNSIE